MTFLLIALVCLVVVAFVVLFVPPLIGNWGQREKTEQL